MKYRLIQIAALMGLTFAAATTEARPQAPTSGLYEGKIARSSPCRLGGGDKRLCQYLQVRLGSGGVIGGSIWAATTIYGSDGRNLYKFDANASSGEEWEKFSKGLSYLKVGADVRMKMSCGHPQCDIESLSLLGKR